MLSSLPLFPEQASSVAARVDALYFFLVAVAGFFSVSIFLLILVFAIRYRRGKHPRAQQIPGSIVLELTWSIIPLALTMVMFVWGASIYFSNNRPPRGAMEIYGVAKQWMWKFEHMEGQREINELHVPVDTDVKMVLISQDVIHSFFVPAFRIREDVLPGPNRYMVTWFHATKPGRYHLFCTEYCGTQHSKMGGWVYVMDPRAYEQWLSSGGEGSLAATGEKLFQQLGCNTCHRADSQAHGPDLAGVFGSPVRLQDGRTVIVDEGFVRQKILNPRATTVAGFQTIMPSFQGQVSEEDVLELIEYIKSLGEQERPGPLKTSPASEQVPGVRQQAVPGPPTSQGATPAPVTTAPPSRAAPKER